MTEIEDAGIVDVMEEGLGVQSDDEIVAAANTWNNLRSDDSDDDPLVLDPFEVDFTGTSDRDTQWWTDHLFERRKNTEPIAPMSEKERPLMQSHPDSILELPEMVKRAPREKVVAGEAPISRGQGFLAILKGFVGTGLLFLPHSFAQGGLMFSCLLIITVFILSMYSMVLLIDCADHAEQHKNNTRMHTFGSIGRLALGKLGSALVNISVFFAQLGFCSVYCVFVSKNLSDMVNSWTKFTISETTILYVLIPFLIPISWVKQLKSLSPAIILANLCISAATVLIIIIAVGVVALFGTSANLVTSESLIINNKTWPLTLGFTLYVWEGIGLVIPIKNSLEPFESRGVRYTSTLYSTLLVVLCLYCLFGGLLFCTYGQEVDQVVLISLPETSVTICIQAMFTVSALCSFPLQFFPAARIAERFFLYRVLSVLGLNISIDSERLMYARSSIRTMLVLGVICVALTMKARLDLLTSFIGCLCCLPLSLVYPALFHLKTRENIKKIGEIEAMHSLPLPKMIMNLSVRPVNYIMIILGITAMIFDGQQTTKAFMESFEAWVKETPHHIKPVVTTNSSTSTIAPAVGMTTTVQPSLNSTTSSSNGRKTTTPTPNTTTPVSSSVSTSNISMSSKEIKKQSNNNSVPTIDNKNQNVF